MARAALVKSARHPSGAGLAGAKQKKVRETAIYRRAPRPLAGRLGDAVLRPILGLAFVFGSLALRQSGERPNYGDWYD